MINSGNMSRRQKTLPRVYPKKKAVQLQTNQGEPSMYPAQTKGKSRGEIRSGPHIPNGTYGGVRGR